MDIAIIVGLSICSFGVVMFTVIQQFRHRAETIKNKEEQLAQKDELLQEFKNLVTGGDSFLFLTPLTIEDRGEVIFQLEFKGKYPLYDASIFIEEFDLESTTENQYQFQRISQRSLALGTINPLQKNTLFNVAIPKSDVGQFGKRYFFKISSRNGMVEQDVYLRKEGPHFSTAYKVIYFEPDYSGQFGSIGIGKIQKKVRYIDPAFPVQQLDHLNGDSGWKGNFEISTGASI